MERYQSEEAKKKDNSLRHIDFVSI